MANNQLKEELILSTSQFDKNINSVIKKVEELKSKGSNVGNGFNASMGKMMGSATKLAGALGLITSGVQLAEWFQNSVREGVKLAEEAEGIRIAFERLNRGDLLEQLRKETHNTVTDLELMKQAVKFNDFNLSLDQMGTFLAFAQQKAKDTGESIDYMVNSIVTGLGRQSLPILDNLGLSATEIKKRMKEGCDMTTAVAQIIKEKMEAAGGYVETASDRAKKQEVEIQNALEELGRTFQPLTETSSNFFHSIELGAIKAINKLRPLINEFTELGRIVNQYQKIGGDEKVNRMIGNLGTGKGERAFSVYKKQLAEFDRYETKLNNKLAALSFGKQDAITNGLIQQTKEEIAAVQKMRANYKKLANDLHNAKPTAVEPTGSTTTTKPKKVTTNKVNYAEGSVGYYEELISELQKKIKLQVDSSEIKKLQDEINVAQGRLDNLLNPKKPLKLEKIETNGLFGGINDKLIEKQLKEFKPQIMSISEQFKHEEEKITNILEAYDIGIIGSKKAKQLIAQVNETLQAQGLKPIKVPIETEFQGKMNDVNLGASSILDSFQGIDSVIDSMTSLANSISEGANAWEVFMGVLQTGVGILQTISSVLNTVNTLQELFGTTSLVAAEQNAAAGATEMATSAGVTAAKSGEAIAGATASGAKMPFPLNIVAIAAGVAAVIGALAMITDAFAEGGVVGGSNYAGDALLARVNSGEMILNGSQQKNLFDMIDKGGNGGINGGNVNFVIRGKDLHGVLSNYDDKMKKVR